MMNLALEIPYWGQSLLRVLGGIGAVLLFGILPCLMAWKCRYTLQETKRILVYGGKPVLIMVIIFSLFILSLSIREIF